MTVHALYYTRSNGDLERIADMVHTHLVSALAKLQREEPDREDEIVAMQAQVALNEARFADQRRVLEAEGWTVEPAWNPATERDEWRACQIDKDCIHAKTEDAAWAKAWAHAHPNA